MGDIPNGLIKEPALKSYQRKGLHWLVSKENDKKWRGGMLCDDMGLGKTVQMIALMCANRCNEQDHRPNLIVAPVALLEQWESEIRKWSKRTFPKIIRYHGYGRTKKIEQLKKADIIITSYGLVGNERPTKSKNDDGTWEHFPGGPLHRVSYWRVILDEAHSIKNRRTKVAQG